MDAAADVPPPPLREDCCVVTAPSLAKARGGKPAKSPGSSARTAEKERVPTVCRSLKKRRMPICTARGKFSKFCGTARPPVSRRLRRAAAHSSCGSHACQNGVRGGREAGDTTSSSSSGGLPPRGWPWMRKHARVPAVQRRHPCPRLAHEAMHQVLAQAGPVHQCRVAHTAV